MKKEHLWWGSPICNLIFKVDHYPNEILDKLFYSVTDTKKWVSFNVTLCDSVGNKQITRITYG